MGLLNKSVYEPLVDFRGIAEWGEDLDDDTPMEVAVHAPDPPMLTEDRDAQAVLPPLVAAKLLYNSKAQRDLTNPMMEVLADAAEEILESEDAAREFTFEDCLNVEFDQFLQQATEDDLADVDEELVFAHMFRRSIPKLVSDLASADQSFRAELMVKRGGVLWAKVHAPLHGPAFFSAFALFALIEQWAHDADYEATTVPSMVALSALCDIYFDALNQERWDTMGALTMFNAAVSRFALADDPRAELETARTAAPA